MTIFTTEDEYMSEIDIAKRNISNAVLLEKRERLKYLFAKVDSYQDEIRELSVQIVQLKKDISYYSKRLRDRGVI